MPVSFCRALGALILLCAVLRGAPAGAHAVYIFAWAEPGRICTDSYFSKKSKVRDGEVSMRGAVGDLLAEGRSDSNGIACFAVPEHIRAGGQGAVEDLLFVVLAGQGHRAEFLLPAAQVEQALVPSGTGTEPASSPGSFASGGAAPTTPSAPVETSPGGAPPPESAGIHAPEGPRLRDILGGLGWIVGLAGIGAWWTSRKRGR